METKPQYFKEFEKSLDKRLSTFATKDDLDNKLESQTRELKKYADEQTDYLARITGKSFNEVSDQVFVLEQKMDTMASALHKHR